MTDQTVFDLGMNNGDDTDFYLRKGFRVVAVDANPQLCIKARERFAAEIRDGRLRVVHGAIAAAPGTLELFLNEDVSGWSTANPRWLESRTLAHTSSRSVTVPAVTLAELVAEHGVPYYLKADIQGAEIACLRGLLALAVRPQCISVSAGTDVLRHAIMRHARAQIELLAQLGYDRFKVVSQQHTNLQRCPSPAREGSYVDYRFNHGASGLFGRELPGEWLDAAAALREHRRIVWGYRLAGHSRSPAAWFGRIPVEKVKFALDRPFWRGLGWYDTHAMRSDRP